MHKLKRKRRELDSNYKEELKQGDPISPKLFTSILENQFRKLNWVDEGININGERLTNLRFADDVVLIAKSAEELEQMLDSLNTVSQEVGLTMNEAKTKVMTNRDEKQISANGKSLQYVQQYTYLGQIIAMERKQNAEIKRRIGNAWNKFWSLKFILTNRAYSLRSRLEVLQSCVIPVLIYGSQTWSNTAKETRMLQVCQRAMERRILGVTRRDKIRNTEIRRLTNLPDVTNIAEKQKWMWAGHVARMADSRWAYKATTWDPRNGRRAAGRPKIRWADSLANKAGKLWTRIARNRSDWKALWKDQGKV